MATKRIHFKDSRYRIGGRLSDFYQLERKLEKWGAENISTTVTTPDFVLIGPACGSKESKALAAGLPILYSSQLLEALENGYFDYETTFIEEDLDLDHTIAELRGLFAQAPSSKSWTTCLELIERCPDAQIEPVLHYISQGMARWPEKERAISWEPDTKHELLKGVHNLWRKSCPPDELCVAPPLWMYELLNKEVIRHDKFKLVRALNCESMRLNQYSFKRLLTHPDLEHVKIINLGSRNNCSSSFLEKLSDFDVARKAEEIWFFGGHHLASALGNSKRAFEHLKVVRLESYMFHKTHGVPSKFRMIPAFPPDLRFEPIPYRP